MPSSYSAIGTATAETIKEYTPQNPRRNILCRSARFHIRRYRKSIAITQQMVALQFLCLTGINETCVGANINSGK